MMMSLLVYCLLVLRNCSNILQKIKLKKYNKTVFVKYMLILSQQSKLNDDYYLYLLLFHVMIFESAIE